jgi:hypothetical protein
MKKRRVPADACTNKGMVLTVGYLSMGGSGTVES